MTALEVLPIDDSCPEIVAALRARGGLIVCAPPGAGKTTRVPRALHDEGFASHGEILVLEPRRLAARLAAARVASEFGQRVGQTAGFSIRFESVAGPDTRIRFVTEGIFSRMILQNPRLLGVSVVILDEFHERHLATDLALAFLRRLQMESRPELKLIVMSATLDAAPIAEYLGDVPVISSEGARFEVAVEYETRQDERPLHKRVARAVLKLLEEKLDGHVLVFLPGAAEIRMASEILGDLARRSGLLLLPLHGDLPAAAQARAVEPSEQRKLILATNVAETSVTIPGIAAVIDSGLARVAGHSAWSGLPTLSLAKVSKASAIQRTGRAGRTRDGRALRLYTRHDFESRPEHDMPEIKRADLSDSVLTLHGAGISDLRSFTWFDAPSEISLRAAENLLTQLGALEPSGTLTQSGRQMLRFPVHPRLARLIVEGEKLGVAEQACLLAALLGERDLRLEARSDLGRPAAPRTKDHAGPSDLLERIESFREAESARGDPRHQRSLGLDPRVVESVDRARAQLRRLIKHGKSTVRDQDEAQALMVATLSAFPDRVARRRGPGQVEFLLASGGSGRLAATSVVQLAPLIVAVDAEARTGSKGTRDSSSVLIRLASAVEPEWLAGLFPEAITQKTTLFWNGGAERVDEASQTLYRDLVLEESVRPALASEAVSQILLDRARARGLPLFSDGEQVPALRARMALLAHHFPSAGLRLLDDSQIADAIAACCIGKRSIEELNHYRLKPVGFFSTESRDCG